MQIISSTLQSELPAISCNKLYDALADCLYDIEVFHRKVPRGSFIIPDSPYYEACNIYRRAERVLCCTAWAIGISPKALDAALYTIHRWYEHTGWQKYLPDGDADRLLCYMIGFYGG